MEDDDRIVLLPTDGDPGAEIELRAVKNSLEREPEEEEDGNDSVAARSADPMDRDPAFIVYVAAVTAAIGGLLFGYDMGVISGAKAPMQRDMGLSCSRIELVVAFLPVGAFVASVVGGTAVDKYGRRLTIVVNAFLFTGGALVLATSTTFGFLLAGRFVLGFAVALSAIAECIYISEIAPPEKRGMLVSLNELGITVGILLAYLVNYTFAAVDGGWRIMFGLSSVIAVVQGGVMSLMPRTPRFLMIKKKEEKAEKTLRDLRLTTNVRQTMTNIRLGLADEQSGGGFFSALVTNADNIRSRLFIGLGLVLLQQFSGQPNIIYYANDVFREVGFCSEFSSALATVFLGLMKVVSTVVSLVLVDRIGRRKALLSGVSAMMISVFTLAVFAIYHQKLNGGVHSETCHEVVRHNATHLYVDVSSGNETETADLFVEPLNITAVATCPGGSSSKGSSMRYLAFAALVGFVCSYSFGFGPITWVILSEIFPASSKGRAMAFATAFNWFGNIIVSATFLEATKTFTLGGVFVFYTLMCAVAIAFVFFVVPETKGRSLEEISKELKSKSTKSLMRENANCCGRTSPQRHEADYSPLHFTI